jgi:HPt (histidine-containing phosphotransfer) domain-containing protein
MDQTFLTQLGIDYDKGLRICMGDPVFFKTLLTMFLKDDCFPRARVAYAEGNDQALFSCLHELKGVSGNAALTALYDSVVPLVELLRAGVTDRTELDRLFAAANAVYQRIYDGIKTAVGE